MSLGWLFLAVSLLLSLQNSKDDPAQRITREGPIREPDEVIVVKRPKEPKTGRMGELSEADEAKLDKIVNDFIQHDLGARPNPASARQLDSLGQEAIPAIVRGINKSAGYSHSCPVTVLSAKLSQLIRGSEDPAVLRFIRFEVGAGVVGNRYAGILNRLKAETTLRQAKLNQLSKMAEKDRPKSPGDGAGKDPGKNP